MKNFNNLISSLLDKKEPQSPYQVINGSYQAKQKTLLQQLKVNGLVVLGPQVEVCNDLIVNGKLDAKYTSFNFLLNVNGTTIINDCIVNQAEICGSLQLLNSRVNKKILFLGTQAFFSNTQLCSLYVKKLPFINIKQVCKFQNNCSIIGDVIFESGCGEVHLDESSNIIGSVKGGHVIQTV